MLETFRVRCLYDRGMRHKGQRNHSDAVCDPPPPESTALIAKLTLGCPSSQGTVVIDDMVEGKGQDEEGAVTGSVHLKGDISLIQTNRLPFLGQRRLEQFSSHLIGILCTCCFSSTGSQFDKFLIHTNL